MSAKTKSKQTRIVHNDYVPPAGFSAFPPAVYHASTVIFDTVDALRSREWIGRDTYTYGLHGTPTTFTLEAQLADIEGGTTAYWLPVVWLPSRSSIWRF